MGHGIVWIIFGRAGRAKHSNLAGVAVRPQNLKRLFHILERPQQNFPIQAIQGLLGNAHQALQNSLDQLAMLQAGELLNQLSQIPLELG